MQAGDSDAPVEIVPLGRDRLGQVGAVFAASHGSNTAGLHPRP